MTDVDFARMDAARVGAPDPEIVTLEARLRVAQLTADVPALDALIAEELLFTGPDGALASKAADLAAHASGGVRFRAHEPEELRMRQIGADVAVTSLRAQLAVEVAGTLVETPARYTRVWVREADCVWRVAAGHMNLVPPAPGQADAGS